VDSEQVVLIYSRRLEFHKRAYSVTKHLGCSLGTASRVFQKLIHSLPGHYCFTLASINSFRCFITAKLNGTILVRTRAEKVVPNAADGRM